MQVDVVCPHAAGRPFFEISEGIRIHRFAYFRPLKLQRLAYGVGIMSNLRRYPWTVFQVPLFLYAQWAAAKRILDRYQSNLIHYHWTIPQGLPAILLQNQFGCPAIASIHGSDLFSMQNPALKKLNSQIIRKSAICTANSSATARMAKVLSRRDDIQTIPMGVDMDQFAGLRLRASKSQDTLEKGPCLLYVGRLIRWKGVDYLLRAFARFALRHPNAHLIIVGMGEEAANLKALATSLKISAMVDFKGFVAHTELPSLYRQADIFILPSIIDQTGETEGLGTVLLEAMAAGVPVIGSRVGGIPDIITDNVSGLLFTPKNDLELADCILRLWDDPELRDRLTINALTRLSDSFSWPAVADHFEALYQRLINPS